MRALTVLFLTLNLAIFATGEHGGSLRGERDNDQVDSHGPEDEDEDEGRGHHGRGEGKQRPPSPPEFQDLVDACEQDMQTYCVNSDNMGECFAANSACFSPACLAAVNNAKVAHGNRQHRPRHHGDGGGRHHVPSAVIQACSEDKGMLCPDLHGREAVACMHDNFADLSQGCQSAIAEFQANRPTPPAAVIAACANDKETLCPGLDGRELHHCMKVHAAQLSSGCQNALNQFVHPNPMVPSPSGGSAVAPPASSSVNVPVESVAVAVPVPAIAPVPVPASISCVSTPSGASSLPSDPTVVEVINEAYDVSNDGNRMAPPHHGVFAVVGAAGVGILLFVAVGVAIRRYRAARRSGPLAPTTSESRQGFEISNPLAAPLSYAVLDESHAEGMQIVQGIPVA